MHATSLPSLDPTIFRAYDIRGIVGQSLTEESIYLLGQALGSYALERQVSQLVCARDGRLSSPILFPALCAGILATGCDVLDIGMVPTPLLYYAAHLLPPHSGVMLTGSHNPAHYNGIKMVFQGQSLESTAIQALYERILQRRFAQGTGTYQTHDIVAQYQQAIIQQVQLARPLKVVVDAGNGVSGLIAPALLQALGCKVIALHCDIDGRFPHHHPDPSQPENLQDLSEAVQLHQADMGLAFDGDGDRLGVVTCKGEVIWPDRLLMLYAQALLQKNPQSKIIFDVKCTDHLSQFIRTLGGEPVMWKTGHSHIKAKLQETGAQLAGEMSGHFFFPYRWFAFDDALFASLHLCEILSHSTLSSNDLFAALPNSVNTPELKVYVNDDEKFSVMAELTAAAIFQEALAVTTIDGVRVHFPDGWGLLRPSNTTPCLVLRFEALNETILQNIQALFRTWILSVRPDLILPF